MNNPQDIVLRMEKDEISDGKIAEKILKNAPKEIYGYFAVPKVIE
jgi:aspartyl/glutamyl-tRNA(Asn/Gln) amidotransferase C subunit